MKTIIIMAIITTTVLQSCMKEQKVSDEVLVSITNECRARIYLYNYDTGRQYLSDMYDCSYVSMIAIKVVPGKIQSESRNLPGKDSYQNF